ncbi:hypothetical protein E8E14_010005 [Neopestalotiopsis sp. 37M]|nr:hypothetical protein E8E14_010005 [Neopestalotiopsis sp. 37M]
MRLSMTNASVATALFNPSVRLPPVCATPPAQPKPMASPVYKAGSRVSALRRRQQPEQIVRQHQPVPALARALAIRAEVTGQLMSNHWKWVIMIVIVVVGIGGIWIGACIWRRKYLKKKDRMYELGKGLPSTVAVDAQGKLVGPGARAGDQPGLFMSGPGTEAGAEKPQKERKRWNVKERT